MLRLPWLRVRTAPRRERWRAVPGREPVQEERATDQEHGERAPGSPREGIMAERARSTEPALAGLVGGLQLRDPHAGLSAGWLPRWRSPQALQPPSAH